MRKLLNTLYVTTPEAYLAKDGENIVVKIEQEERFRIPILNLENVVCFSYMGASPGVMKLCVDNGVGLCFMTPKGRFIARIHGMTKGNVYLRNRQHILTQHEDRRLDISRFMIAGKILNSRSVLSRYLRDYGDNEDIEKAIDRLFSIKRKVLETASEEELLGLEGQAANIYFGVFSNLIVRQKDHFAFDGRNKYPPKDSVNAMLSFAYSLLTNDIASALEATGLDPYVGVYHKLRPGRMSLALDIIEEFRAYLCDRFVLSLINRQQISAKDFEENIGIRLSDNGRRKFIQAWQERKKETIIHPFLKEKVEIGLLPHIQAQMLARKIRGDLASYPVFIYK